MPKQVILLPPDKVLEIVNEQILVGLSLKQIAQTFFRTSENTLYKFLRNNGFKRERQWIRNYEEPMRAPELDPVQ